MGSALSADGYSWFMVDRSQAIETLKTRIRMLELRKQRVLIALEVEGSTPEYRLQLRMDLVKIDSQLFDLEFELRQKTEVQ